MQELIAVIRAYVDGYDVFIYVHEKDLLVDNNVTFCLILILLFYYIICFE